MLAAPTRIFQVLTKRPERARDYFDHVVSTFDTRSRVWSIAASVVGASRERGGWPSDEWPLSNVWVGVSIENARYTWRADVLREIPAAVRFISAEPLLGSLFKSAGPSPARALEPAQPGEASGVGNEPDRRARRSPLDLTGIDWVIVGGESGPGARPFHLEHAREIIDAAAEHSDHMYEGGPDGPAVFVKQLGAKPMHQDHPRITREVPLRLLDRKGGDWSEWPADLRIREFPRSAA
jgi:protein gp37